MVNHTTKQIGTRRASQRLRLGGRLSVDWFLILALVLSIGTVAVVLYPLVVVAFNVFIRDGGSLIATAQSIITAGIGKVLFDTMLVIGLSILIATGVGSVFAWLVERTDLGMRGLTRFLPMIPLFVPPIAGAIGWVILASPRSGFLNRWAQQLAAMVGIEIDGPIVNLYSLTGLIFVFVIYLIPNIFMTVSSHLRNLDPTLEEAARMSGAGVWRTLVHVTLPSVRPAAIAGMLLALIMGLSLFSLPLIVGGPARIELLAVRIVNLMIASYPPRTGAALLLALFVAIVILMASWLQSRVLRKGNFATIGGRGVGGARVALGHYRWPARFVLLCYLAASTILPFVALVIVSLQPFWTPLINVANFKLIHYQSIFFESGFAHAAILNSIWLGAIGATLGVGLAAMIAFFLNANRARRVASLVDAVTKLPGAVSHLVIGIAFVVAFSAAPFNLYGTTTILLLAYIVLYIPQATLTANAAFSQVSAQLKEAALMSGASQGSTFLRVTLPLMLPGLVAGWTLLFILISGDITASAMLAGNRNPVVGFVILDLWSGGSFPQLAALGSVMTVLSSAVVLVTMRFARQPHFN